MSHSQIEVNEGGVLLDDFNPLETELKNFKKLLVAVDTRIEDHPIVDEAAEIAKKNDASLLVVDVVPEFSWTVRRSLQDHEHLQELITEEKEEQLAKLRTSLQKKGIDAKTAVLHGKTSVEIIRQVLRGKHDLVLRVAKGQDSSSKGFFGTTGFRLLRQCPCAVWLVAPNTTPKFKHVLGCVDTSSGEELDAELNAQVLELGATVSEYHGGKFSILHAWSIFNEKMLQRRMQADKFEQMVLSSRDKVQELLEQFLQNNANAPHPENVHLIKGEAVRIVPAFTREYNVDLVVMGTVARSGLLGMVMGNTAEQILNQVACSVLALKPPEFDCPVELEK